MLSTWKLLTTTLLLGSTLFASDQNESVEDFLEDTFSNNPNIVSLDTKVVQSTPLDIPKGWNGLIVNVDATLKARPKNREIHQKMIWFTNGAVITKNLFDLQTGENLTDLVTPKFKDEYYTKENLIYGYANAKHKVAIFSDPLCPFCRKFVPGAIEYMKKYPKKYAIYYYHFPLDNIHPASVQLTQAAVAAELQGYKDAELKLYKVKVNPREKNVEKILAVFNREFGTKLTQSDLNSKEVKERLDHDKGIANDVMVQGTPTMFLDGKMDITKQKYKDVK